MATIQVHRWRGAAAVTLSAGDLAATFLPEVGMMGASLTWQGHDLVAFPRGIGAAVDRHTAGLPLLHPWANRLGKRRYVAAGAAVDLRRLALHTDSTGMLMHGTMLGRPGWDVAAMATTRRRATLTARFDYSAHPALLAAFPFPHVIEITVSVAADRMEVTTTVRALEGPVPVSFGWHPYFRVPGPRRSWRLHLPERDHLVLNTKMIPTGRRRHEAAEAEPIGSRTFDDAYALGTERRFALTGAGVHLEVAFDGGYPFAQLWVPQGRRFACIEPMTAPTNALLTDTYALAEPGAPYSASYSMRPSAAP
jgi:aldose 1-epimerase